MVSLVPRRIATARGDVEHVAFGEGPTVFALHGAMGGWDQASILARAVDLAGFRVLALSRPGYLRTPSSSGPTPEQQADLYTATLDALGIERAGAVAISGGGLSAIQFALRHPDRCWALVLVSTVGAPVTGRLPLRFQLTLWLGQRAWFSQWVRRRAARNPGAAAKRAIPDPEVRERTLDDPDAGPLFGEMLALASHRMAMRLDGTRQDVQASRLPMPPLERIAVPTLVVHGTHDRVVPFERNGAVLAKRIPGAELLALAGGNHVAIFTHRALVRDRTGQFLRAHSP